MDFSSHFESKYLGASDIALHEPMHVVCDVVHEAEVGQTRQVKLILTFKNIKKGLVLNKTNGQKLMKLFGNESDNWVGKHVALVTDVTEFDGKPVACVRVQEYIAPPTTAPIASEPAYDL